jgi:hypothetical protein
MALGRNSAVWDHTAQQGRVFVAAQEDRIDSLGRPQLWDRFWDGLRWSWEPLDNPFGTLAGPDEQVVEMLSPVAVDGVQQDGTYVVTVFVVGLHVINANSADPQLRYELYAREKYGTYGWGDWIHLGNPTASFTAPANQAAAFVVDQGALWKDPNLPVLRGALFGTLPNGVLIHLFHDNNGWQWDTPASLPGGTLITSHVSCAVLTNVYGSPGWHLTALMRDTNGTIWNRQYDNSNNGTWAQHWQ